MNLFSNFSSAIFHFPKTEFLLYNFPDPTTKSWASGTFAKTAGHAEANKSKPLAGTKLPTYATFKLRFSKG